MPVDGEWHKCVCMCGNTRGSTGIPSITLHFHSWYMGGGGGYIWAKEEKEFWLKQGQRGSTINLKRKKKQCNCYFSVPLTLQVGVILVSKPRQWVEVCMCVCVLGGLHQSLEEDTSVHKERKMSTVRVGEKEEIGRTEEEGRWGWWAWRANLLACVIAQMCTVFVSCVCVDWGGAQQWTAVFIRAQTLSHFKSGACLSLKSMYLWCLWQQVSGGGRLWMMVSRIPSHNNGDHGLPTMWCHFWAADEGEWCIEKEGCGMLLRENENKMIQRWEYCINLKKCSQDCLTFVSHICCQPKHRV